MPIQLPHSHIGSPHLEDQGCWNVCLWEYLYTPKSKEATFPLTASLNPTHKKKRAKINSFFFSWIIFLTFGLSWAYFSVALLCFNLITGFISPGQRLPNSQNHVLVSNGCIRTVHHNQQRGFGTFQNEAW